MPKRSLMTKLNQARPRLKFLAPLTYRICQGFIGVNLAIAAVFFFAQTTVKTVPNPVIQGFFGFEFWGFVYLALALTMSYGLIRNDFKVTRKAMIAGLFTKTMWTIALLILAFQGYNIFITLVFWLMLTWVQIWTIVHFMPVINWNSTSDQNGNQ